MSTALHHNISGESATELIKVGERARIGSVHFCNLHATLPCFVDLYIKKVGSGTFYLIKNVKLPAGASLESSIGSFSNDIEGFNLYVKLTKSASETPIVDVILM